MTGQPPITNVPSTDVPSVKKNMALAALVLTIIASLLIILGLIALIKSRPKTMPLIIFLVVIFLPSIARR